jgi:hypothetical protein
MPRDRLTPYPWHMATITLDIQSELPKAIRWTDTMTKQLPFAISQALNSTAFDARTSINASTRQYFDNPTRFIQNAYRVEKSTKRTLTAILFPEAKRQPYLLRNITGGQRGTKPFEAKLIAASSGAIQSGAKLVPVGLKRNAQGNVSLATLKRITRQIGPTGRNSVFIGTPKGGNRSPGVYQRVGQKLRPLFVSLPSATYRPIFPVQQIGTKVAERRFGGYLRSSLEKALASAR